MKNIILALILAAPVNFALAQDPNMRMEAVGGCPECEIRSAQSNTTGLQRISLPEPSRIPSSATAMLDLGALVNMIGRIETRYTIKVGAQTGISEANGVLVSPCHMLTNHHVVFGDERNPDLATDRNVYFYVGRGTKAFKYRLEGKVVNRVRTSTDDSGDYALVHMPSCPGKTLGWIEPKPVSAIDLKSARFSMAAIPTAATDGKIQVQHCLVSGREPGSGRILTTCTSLPGHSGGALVVPDQDTNIGLVALNQGVTNSGTARAVTLYEVLADPQITACLNADKQTFVAERAGATRQASARSQSPRSL